jgi:hypothetical protein
MNSTAFWIVMMFWGNILHSYYNMQETNFLPAFAGFLLDSLFKPEDGGDTYLKSTEC